MDIHTFTGSKTQEYCIWVVDQRDNSQRWRWICLSYEYDHATGRLKYAASVYRFTDEQREAGYHLTEQEIAGHVETTTKRFTLRPVETLIPSYLEYDQLITEIRHQMCHGMGVKGLRKQVDRWFPQSVESDCSSDGRLTPDADEHSVTPETFKLKTVRRFHLVLETKEDYKAYGLKPDDQRREIFLVCKGRHSNGDVVYGASIHREWLPQSVSGLDYYPAVLELGEDQIESHFLTAEDRMIKCPVQMKVSKAARKTLRGPVAIDTALTKDLVQNVFVRRCGQLQIRGDRSKSPMPEVIEVSPQTYEMRTVHRSLYYEKNVDEGTQCHYYIAFKGRPSTGELIYSVVTRESVLDSEAPIDCDSIFDKAEEILDRGNAFQMKIPREYRGQLSAKSPHAEDVMYTIIENFGLQERYGLLDSSGKLRGGVARV